MKDSDFFLRITDVGEISDTYAPRYRSIFHEEPYGTPGLRFLHCYQALDSEWSWLSSADQIRECYVQLKVKRVL